MPTARELIEQADALMRRNRTSAIDDIPVLTDAIPVAEAQLLVRRRFDEDEVSAPVSPDPIPTLTERVESPVVATADVVMVEGEASDWLDFDEAQPSVIGEAPDSIAIVPPVKLAKGSDEALLESAEHEEIELTSAVEEDFDDELAALAKEPPDSPAPDEARPTMNAPPTPVITPAEMPSVAALAAALAAAVPAQPMPPGTPPPEASSTGSSPTEEPVMTPTHEAAAAPEPEVSPVPPEHEWLLAPEPAEVATAPAASAPWDDQARWDMAAEEIRMQVLQRIDLFTDTGLREQLGQRLKPIVDRASADLVATINRHVGELLRAYVAEAIEREIERWREEH